MKVVFLGTPNFGVPALEKLIQYQDVLACVCQPDKLGARNKIEYCAVKKFALAHDIPVFQFEKISRDGVETLKNLAPDIMVTAAYGQILSQEIIDIAPHGIVNIHGSLLPALRGAAPIQYAVWQGLTETGITILKTVKKVDAGAIILQKKLSILPYETNGSLFERMSLLGAEAIVEALSQIENGSASFTEQDESKATFCSKISAEEEHIDWNKSQSELINLVRALCPSPSAWTTLFGKRLKIYELRPCDGNFDEFLPGQICFVSKKAIAVKCLDGALFINELQKENGNRMNIASFLCGNKISLGTELGK